MQRTGNCLHCSKTKKPNKKINNKKKQQKKKTKKKSYKDEVIT